MNGLGAFFLVENMCQMFLLDQIELNWVQFVYYTYIYTKIMFFERCLGFSWHYLILQALKFFANQKRFFDKLVEISLASLARDGGSENGFSLSSAIVNFVLQKDGVQHAREMYKQYVASFWATEHLFYEFFKISTFFGAWI